MQLSHTRPVAAARFDDPNLVSTAGLVPVMALAQPGGLLSPGRSAPERADRQRRQRRPQDRLAGRWHGRRRRQHRRPGDPAARRDGNDFDRPYAPSTVGSFLREFTFGHVRQLDAVASRFLGDLAGGPRWSPASNRTVLVDIDDTIIEVHGHGKQGSGYGYSGVRGLNALIATVTTETAAPVIVGQRLRRGACGSPRGAARMVADTLATGGPAAATTPPRVWVWVRRRRCWCGSIRRSTDSGIGAAIRAGADVSVTVRQTHTVKLRSHRSTTVPGHPSSTPTPSTTRTPTPGSRGRRSPRSFTAFASQSKATRYPGGWSCAASPTSTSRPPTRARCSTSGGSTPSSPPPTSYRRRRQNPPSSRDRRTGACGPEELRPRASTVELFSANAAWLVCAVMAFNLTRAAATLTGVPRLTKATTGTIRRTLVSVPARIASSARRLTLHLPTDWPWETAWNNLFDSMFHRTSRSSPNSRHPPTLDAKDPVEQPDTEVGHHPRPHPTAATQRNSPPRPQSIGGFRLSRGQEKGRWPIPSPSVRLTS